MGVFSSLIGDVPGDLSAIDHLAAQIHDQAEAVQIIGDEFCTTIRKTTIWAGRSREAFEAVSYTHLDVYKRQVLSLRRKCLPVCTFGISCTFFHH